MKRLDSKKSLVDQSFEGTYSLMCSPVKLLKVLSIISCSPSFSFFLSFFLFHLSFLSFFFIFLLFRKPSNTLQGKDGISRCTEVFKEGFLVKQTRKGSKQTAKRRRWAVLKDQFLFYFKNKGVSAFSSSVLLLFLD